MFWEKKNKEKGLPDLPQISSRPTLRMPPMHEMEEENEEIHELPSFPDSPMHRGFSQMAIKEAISNEDIREDTSEMHMPPKDSHKIIEMEEWSPQSRIPQLGPARENKENKPIFVRIDKFQLARGALEDVKGKLTEIEALLKTIRDVKAKEDMELSSWESEMENVKARVQTVLNDIFEKAE